MGAVDTAGAATDPNIAAVLRIYACGWRNYWRIG
jgi:hypothetical protein